MITNDERHEVAVRLRELDTSRWYDGMDEVCALEDACGCSIGQDWQDMELKDRLAKLIEPELKRTCHNLGGEEGTNYELYDFGCSLCGYCADITEPNYCPYCGAKVVEE